MTQSSSTLTPPVSTSRRQALCSALIAVCIRALALAGWLYTRPRVYDNGTAEVIYTDSDGSYQLLLSYFSDRFQSISDYTEKVEEDKEYRMPSRLYVNHVETGSNAKEAFFRKVAWVTVEIIQADSPSPWRCSEPVFMDFALEAARISFLDFTGRSGPMELVWTLRMNSGDTIRLHQRVELDVIPTLHYFPEDAPMDTIAQLQALVDEINETSDPSAVVYLHLPAVTYEGGLVLEGRPVNLLGSEGPGRGRSTSESPRPLPESLLLWHGYRLPRKSDCLPSQRGPGFRRKYPIYQRNEQSFVKPTPPLL